MILGAIPRISMNIDSCPWPEGQGRTVLLPGRRNMRTLLGRFGYGRVR
jgi:hypothetical protein